MSTRGVLIVRGEEKKPQYFYVRSDADMYPEFARDISGRTPREYVGRINKRLSRGAVEGYPFGMAPREYVGRIKRRVSSSAKGYAFDPDFIRPMGDVEARNYISDTSVTPDHVYVIDLGEKNKMEHYTPNPYCGPDEIYIPAYVKDDGTYVRGYCKKTR